VLNLSEYRRTEKRLADYLPWACLVAPGVILNKDGSFQRTLRYRGPTSIAPPRPSSLPFLPALTPR
jgi:type IV secretory pathway VirB4 component